MSKLFLRGSLGGCLDVFGGKKTFNLREKYTYIVDSYDFNDEPLSLNPTTWINQQLGYWNFSSNDVMDEIPFAGGFYYTRVDNGDFREARRETGRGGDFTVYSDIKTDQTYEAIEIP